MDVIQSGLCFLWSSASDDNLIEDNIVENPKVLCAELVSDVLGVRTQSINQIAYAVTTHGDKRRPQFYPAGAARHVSGQEHVFALVAPLQVGPIGLQCGNQGITVAAENDARIVRRIEGLMGIDRPLVSQFDAVTEMAVVFRCCGP